MSVAPATHAQDDWRIELQRLQQQLANQQRQIDLQSRTIESQQRRIEEQSRQLDEVRRSSLERPGHHDPAAADSTGARHNEDEPAELPVQPLLAPVGGHTDATESPAAGAQVGYSNGFFFASPDEHGSPKHVPFLLRVNSRLQLRHTVFDSDGPTADENNVELEVARLVFSGFAYTPDFAYFIQLDGDSDDHVTVEWFDYFVTYDMGHALWDCGEGELYLRAGKWRVPFHRARQDSRFVLQMADRATSSIFFDINRGIGVGLGGKRTILDRPVNWDAAVFNGFLVDDLAPGRVDELDRNLAYSARVTSELVGEWGLDGEPDLSWHECPAVKVGAGFAFTRLDRDDGAGEFSELPAFADSGVTEFVSDVLPAAVDQFSVFLYSVDANFKYRGFSLLGEYYFRHLTEFTGAAVANRFDHGFVLQAGRFLVPERVEVAGRWARAVGNSWTLGDSDHSSDELAAGMTWYIRGHNLKFVFDVTHLNGSPVGSDTLNILAGDAGWLVRSQFQLTF
jgi:hypothetical protein